MCSIKSAGAGTDAGAGLGAVAGAGEVCSGQWPLCSGQCAAPPPGIGMLTGQIVLSFSRY